MTAMQRGAPEWVAAARGYKGGLKLFALDLAIGRPPNYAAVLEKYGADGRREMALAHVLWDIVLPVTYVLFFLSAFGLFERSDPSYLGLWKLAAGLSLLAGLADLAENTGIVVLCNTYPADAGWLGGAVTVATHLKWAALALSIAYLLAGLVLVDLPRLF
jgi:hypothetical protein